MSDIVGDGMSCNDPDHDIGYYHVGSCARCGWTQEPVTYRDVYAHQAGCPDSEVRLRAGRPERAILLDLIAELRRYPAGDLLDMSDRYEARLREVTSE